jgi:hypothetical protein
MHHPFKRCHSWFQVLTFTALNLRLLLAPENQIPAEVFRPFFSRFSMARALEEGGATQYAAHLCQRKMSDCDISMSLCAGTLK